MSEYIKREDAEAVIDKQYNRIDESLGFGDIESVRTGVMWGKALIDSIPAAEVVPTSFHDKCMAQDAKKCCDLQRKVDSLEAENNFLKGMCEWYHNTINGMEEEEIKEARRYQK